MNGDNGDNGETVLNGNTNTIKSLKKRENQYIHYCFTFNNYTNYDKMEMETLFLKYCSKYTFEKEIGKTGTSHLQGYVGFKKRKRLSEIKKIFNPRIHWEPCKNIKASIDYCQKDAQSNTDIISKNIHSEKQAFYDYEEFVKIVFDTEYEIFYDEILDIECKKYGELCESYDDLLLMTNSIKWMLDKNLLDKTLDKILRESEDEGVTDKFIQCITYKMNLITT